MVVNLAPTWFVQAVAARMSVVPYTGLTDLVVVHLLTHHDRAGKRPAKQLAVPTYQFHKGVYMFNANDDPKGPSRKEQIGMAVAIAGLSCLVSGLVNWGIHELQLRFGTKPKEPEKVETDLKE